MNKDTCYFGLLDCNNFFVSCERLFRPDLLHKPVLVLSSNDGCVVARSQEVKALGVSMGAPYFQVRDLCEKNGVTIFSTNFSLYRDISARVMSILREQVGEIEQYSVDEAFFMTEAATTRELEQKVIKIKQIVEQCVGVPVSIGVAKTKTIAKYASKKEKRGNGVCVLTPERWQKECDAVPISTIWGIGGKTAAAMQNKGITNVSGLLATDRAVVDRLFGLHGCRLFDELSGVVVHAFGARHQPQQSITSTRSLSKATHTFPVLAEALTHHVHTVAQELRAHNLMTSHVTVIAAPSRHGDWALRPSRRDVVLIEATNDTKILLHEVIQAVCSFFDPEVPYKKIGIVVRSLSDATATQGNLFTQTDGSSDQLMRTIDLMTKRYGAEALQLGYFKRTKLYEGKHEKLSPHYTTRWNDILSANAH